MMRNLINIVEVFSDTQSPILEAVKNSPDQIKSAVLEVLYDFGIEGSMSEYIAADIALKLTTLSTGSHRDAIMRGMAASTKKPGRPPIPDEKRQAIIQFLQSGNSINGTARQLKVGVGTVFRIAQTLRKDSKSNLG